jgi:hypothetical protein
MHFGGTLLCQLSVTLSLEQVLRIGGCLAVPDKQELDPNL